MKPKALGLSLLCAVLALADVTGQETAPAPEATPSALLSTPMPITPAPAAAVTTPAPASQVATPAPAPVAGLVNTPVPLLIPAPVGAPSTVGSTLQLTLYLILMLGLLAAGIYVMRHGLGFLQAKPKGPRKLEITETKMLGNRQFLVVAEYEQRKMLIGVCPGRIEYLCTLSGPEPEFPRLASEEEG